MMTSIALAGLLATTGVVRTEPVLLFSSDAIKVARSAATEWNHGPLPKNAAFDIPDGPTKLQPGYFAVHYLVGVNPVMTIWINLTTGQVVEPDRCLYFTGHEVRTFSAAIRKLTGARPMRLDRLANDIGCDALKAD